MLLTALVSIGLLQGLDVSRAGEIYKWVDAKGRTHFGDKPPEANESTTTVEVTPPSSPALDPNLVERRRKQQKLLEVFSGERKEREKLRREDKAYKAALKKKCAKTRRTLTAVDRANLLYKKDKDGNRQYVNDAQREKLVRELKSSLKKNCWLKRAYAGNR